MTSIRMLILLVKRLIDSKGGDYFVDGQEEKTQALWEAARERNDN